MFLFVQTNAEGDALRYFEVEPSLVSVLQYDASVQMILDVTVYLKMQKKPVPDHGLDTDGSLDPNKDKTSSSEGEEANATRQGNIWFPSTNPFLWGSTPWRDSMLWNQWPGYSTTNASHNNPYGDGNAAGSYAYTGNESSSGSGTTGSQPNQSAQESQGATANPSATPAAIVQGVGIPLTADAQDLRSVLMCVVFGAMAFGTAKLIRRRS